jgi:hypothetical protein
VSFGGRPIFTPRATARVAVSELIEQLAKLRAVGFGSALHFAEHLLASGLGQLAHLRLDALAVR